jgi:uncharacterized protein (TIGR02118 family)
MVKIALLRHRRADLSSRECRRYWLETHWPPLERLPGMRWMVIKDVLPGRDGAHAVCDGIADDWLDGLEAMQEANASHDAQSVRADVLNLLDPSRF